MIGPGGVDQLLKIIVRAPAEFEFGAAVVEPGRVIRTLDVDRGEAAGRLEMGRHLAIIDRYIHGDIVEPAAARRVVEPILVDGKETENVEFYYFDAADFVPILIEVEVKSGPGKGMVSQAKMSDYQEVDGLLFPFSMTAGAKGQPGGQTITFTSIELNPKVEAASFAFPTGN